MNMIDISHPGDMTPLSICLTCLSGYALVQSHLASKSCALQCALGYSFSRFFRNAINALSFSHDGEYLAIANAGTYIDIVCSFPSLPCLVY